MMKILLFIGCLFFSTTILADEVPDRNAAGMRKVHGIIAQKEKVPTSSKVERDDIPSIGNPVADLEIGILDAIFNTNYRGFPIYYVKVSETITLEVASRESFEQDSCVVVWYRDEMGDSPNLSMLGDAGIAKSNQCNAK